ncbi:MAG TPA: YggT family protein [Gemmatimonadales bacterium]|nr:YggT family protein [Gemmatimonadales bacterium]
MSIILLYTIVRTAVIVALAYAAVVAVTHWAVRNRRINPFGSWPRFVRRVSDPLLQPLERRVISAGGNPQNTPLWLLVAVIASGLVLMSLAAWLVDAVVRLRWMVESGPRMWLATLVSLTFTVLMAAILIRVIASWLGIGPYRRWMRPVMALTNWLIDPIRRILPPFGMLDFSPMVAWLVLYVVRGFVMGLLL